MWHDYFLRVKEKIAIVGRNGSGKTTLLKCISGEIIPEEGTGEEGFALYRQSGLIVGYLKQIAFKDDNLTMMDEILDAFKPILDTESKMKSRKIKNNSRRSQKRSNR